MFAKQERLEALVHERREILQQIERTSSNFSKASLHRELEEIDMKIREIV
jgi:hypothetical protein